MKKGNLLIQLLTAIILFVILSAFNIPDIKKNYVKFDDKLYACRYEVTNIEYREFLNDLIATKQNDEYQKCLYDSAQWVKKMSLTFNEPMRAMYHRHPAYDNYPVVNITLEAANLYCAWLTAKYNNSSKKTFKKVLFRLPAETEWEEIAAPLPGHNLPWYGNFPYVDAAGKTALANVKVKNFNGTDNYIFDGGFHTTIVGHYKANNSGVYDIIGNAAEMTKDGAIKGGSWDNYLDECTIDKTQKYEPPDPRVGFRVIMEVQEK